MSTPDVVILGAGVIGLSLALELHRRGHKVALYDPRAAATQASWAAAGMLAARDPHNPPQLGPLARLSAALYPAFLQDLEELSGQPVPLQTSVTVQHLPDGEAERLPESSLDPRQLAVALAIALQRASIPLRQPHPGSGSVPGRYRAPLVVHASGAWATAGDIAPRKGQMLRVQLPQPERLTEVHRSEHVYVVPRTAGPQAGTALIGATVEDAGFNTDTTPEDLANLRLRGAALVAALLPELADPKKTPLVEAWAGLRPATPDQLPMIGELREEASLAGQRHLIAAGHFRNGILLAPATAISVADLIEGRTPSVDLQPFSPARFAQKPTRVDKGSAI